MLLKPGRSALLSGQPSEGMESEDSMGSWCPGRQGRVWLLPSVAHFAFLPFPESTSQDSGLCSPSLQMGGRQILGLGGN